MLNISKLFHWFDQKLQQIARITFSNIIPEVSNVVRVSKGVTKIQKYVNVMILKSCHIVSKLVLINANALKWLFRHFNVTTDYHPERRRLRSQNDAGNRWLHPSVCLFFCMLLWINLWDKGGWNIKEKTRFSYFFCNVWG